MRNFTFHLKLFVLLCLCQCLSAFTYIFSGDEQTEAIQNVLMGHYDDTAGSSVLKRYELNVTNSGFCRYKRIYVSGKVEYFSFNLEKFDHLEYYGTDKQGELWLRTKGDDVIVQTYNDNEGDVDSMATYMDIPVKNMALEDRDTLSNRLLKFTAQRLAQQ